MPLDIFAATAADAAMIAIPNSTSGAEQLDFSVLSGLLEHSIDGIVVLDGRHRFVYVNPAACMILGYPREALLGDDALSHLAERDHPHVRERFYAVMQGHAGRWLTTVLWPNGEERDVEYSSKYLVVEGRPLVAGIIRDVTEQRRTERKAAALAQIASSMTYAGSLEATLDALAESVVEATRGVACTVMLITDGSPPVVRPIGVHGLPSGFAQALGQAVRNGLRPPSFVAFQTRHPLVVRGHREEVMTNPLYAPVWPLMQDGIWDTLVSVPLVYQDCALGCLNVFYPRIPEPGAAEIDFLTAIAGQAAVAAKNAELFADAQGKAALEERQRLARDLHDSVSQTLFSASLIAEVLPHLWERNTGEGKLRLEELRQLTRGAMAEMRMLLLELRPAALTEIALGDLLWQLGEATTGRARLPVEVTVGGPSRALPPDVQVALYRIAQEAVNNAVKHAQATSVNIALRCQHDHVVITVTDDGKGFVQGHSGAEHLGLGIMRERADAIGASFELSSCPGHGARISVVWPEYRKGKQHG